MRGEQSEHNKTAGGPFFEVLTAEELAQRWRVPESWIREQVRSRCSDPIPHVRLGRYVRFSWDLLISTTGGLVGNRRRYISLDSYMALS